MKLPSMRRLTRAQEIQLIELGLQTLLTRALEGAAPKAPRAAPQAKAKRVMSPAARRRIGQAMAARWRKAKAAGRNLNEPKAKAKAPRRPKAAKAAPPSGNPA